MKKLDEILAGKKTVGLAGHVRPDVLSGCGCAIVS